MLLIRFTGGKIETINLGSYNYLGFANNSGPIADNVIKSIQINGLATASTPQEYGSLAQHRKLESLLAQFLGTEDAIAFGMGFATNALNIPSLVGKVNNNKKARVILFDCFFFVFLSRVV